MIIRRALDKDIPRFLELLTQVNMVHHNGRPDLFNGPAQKYSENELEKQFRVPEDPVFVAADDEDRLLGYAVCFSQVIENDSIRTPVRTLYLDDLCVDEKLRGQHIGKALYEHVKNYARKNGYYNLTLHVWECNPSAEAFYRSCGMKPQYTCLEEIL